jgi:hypothetical protein
MSSKTCVYPKPDEKKPCETKEASKSETAQEHRARVITHVNNCNSEVAFEALMTNHVTGARMDYADSRMMYG